MQVWHVDHLNCSIKKAWVETCKFNVFSKHDLRIEAQLILHLYFSSVLFPWINLVTVCFFNFELLKNPKIIKLIFSKFHPDELISNVSKILYKICKSFSKFSLSKF